MTQVILADTTTLQFRGFASGLATMPFIINTFISAEVAQGILTNSSNGWRWGYGCVSLSFLARARAGPPSSRLADTSLSLPAACSPLWCVTPPLSRRVRGRLVR